MTKEILIDLFETRIEHASCDEEYIDGNYWPSIKFDSNLEDSFIMEHNDNYYKKISYDDCKMIILYENNDYYISFNSIKVKIQFSEFKRLKKLFTKVKKRKTEYYKNLEKKKDEELFKKVFLKKLHKEKRVILIEKKSIQKEKTYKKDDIYEEQDE